MKILGREPAVILGLVSAVLQLVVALGLPLSKDQTLAINAAVAAVLGVVTAFYVAHDQLYPAILGFAQAGLALLLAFHFDLSADTTAAVMAVVAGALAVFGVRPHVTPVVAPDGSRVRRVVPGRVIR